MPAGVPVWTGDYPSLAERRAVRMLVVYSKTFYFIDKGQQRGITYDMGMELEKHLNANNKDKTRPIRVVFIPIARDQLLPALAAGVGDIATGGLADHARTQQAGRLHGVLHRERQRDPGHCAGRDAAGHRRRAVRAQRIRASVEQPTTKASWR